MSAMRAWRNPSRSKTTRAARTSCCRERRPRSVLPVPRRGVPVAFDVSSLLRRLAFGMLAERCISAFQPRGGGRGSGEPTVGAGYGAALHEIADAVGVDVFRRARVSADIVLASLDSRKRMHDALASHI